MRYFLPCYKRFRLFCAFLAAVCLLLNIPSCSLHRAALPGAAPSALTAERANSTPEGFNAALDAKKHGRADEAVSELEKIREQYPGTIWFRRASFLLGLNSIENGAPDAVYFNDADGLPHMDDYILFYRAQALLKTGQIAYGASILDNLMTMYPESALRAGTLYMKAAASSANEDFEAAEKGFKGFISAYPDDPLVPEAQLGAAYASYRLKNFDSAIKAARSILVKYPDKPEANAAEALLKEIESEGGAVPGMTDAERFERGKRLFSASRYDDSMAELSVLSGKSGGPYRDRSVLKLAVALTRLKQYEKAEKTLRDYLKVKGAEKELDALNLLAQIELRQGNVDKFLDAGKRIAKKYPKSEEYGRVLLLTGEFYESRDPEKSASFYNKVLDEFKDGPLSSIALDALWDIGWMAYRAGKYEDALARFSSWGRYECRDASRFIYWSGRSAENLGKSKEAADFYGRLCTGYHDTYYCRMAEERLNGLAASGGEVEAQTISSSGADPLIYDQTDLNAAGMPDLILKVSADEHYLAANELLAVGLGSMASKEIDFITKKYAAEPKEAFELAQMFIKSGDYYDALKVYSVYLSGDRARECGRPSDVLALSFPPQVVDLVKETDPGSSDPYLVAAVMREESSFNPGAVSITGALGLMQIMPSTGRTLARKLGAEGFDSKELSDPRTNILYGSRYLDELTRLFDNNTILAIAGYNAGPNAATRWKDTFRLAPDEFIESIPYPETRQYTKKVLKSYIEYLKLSGVPDPLKQILRSTTDEKSVSGIY